MASLNFLRNAGGCLSTQLLRRSFPLASAATVQKKHLTLTPVKQARVYGPSEGKLPEYVGHWKHARLLMISLVPIIPVALAYPHPALDVLLSSALVLHSHWGIEGMVNDYLHDKRLNRAGNTVLLVASISALAGLLYLTYNDIGFAKTVHKIYTEL